MLFDCLLTNFAPLEHIESLEPLVQETFDFDLGLNFPELEDFDPILPDVVNEFINDDPNLLDNILQSCTSPKSLINLDDIVGELPKPEEAETESETSQPQAQPQVQPPKCSPIKLTIWRTSKGLSCKLGSKETVKKTKKIEDSQTTKTKKSSGKGKCKMLESKKTETVKKIKSQSQKYPESSQHPEQPKRTEPSKRSESQKRPEPPKRSESQKRSGECKETATVKTKHSSAEPSAKKKITQPVSKPIKKEAETKQISDRIKTKLQDTKKRTITVIPALPEDPTKKKRGRKPKVDSGKLRLLQSIQIDHDYCLTPISAPKYTKVKKNLPEMKSKQTPVPVTKMATSDKRVPSIQKTEIPATKVLTKPIEKIVSPIQKTEISPKVTKSLEKVEVPIQKTEMTRIKPTEEKIATPVQKTEKAKVVAAQEKVVPQKIEIAEVEPVEKSVPAVQKTETPTVPEMKEQETNTETKVPKQKSISLQSYFKRKAVDPSKTKYEMYDIYYLSTNTGNPGHCEVGFHSIAYPTETIKKIRAVKEKKSSGCQTDITLQSFLRKPRVPKVEESAEPIASEPMNQGRESKPSPVKQIIEKPTEEIIPVIKIDEESTPDFIPVIQIEEEDSAVAMPSSNNNKQINNQNLTPSEPATYSSVKDDDCSSRGSSTKRKRRDSSRSSRSSSSDSDDSRRYRRKSRRSRSPSSDRRRRLLSDVDRDYYSRSCDSRSSNYSSASSSRLSSPNYRASVYSSNSSRSSSNSPHYSDNSKRSYNSSSRRNYPEASYSSRSHHSESRYRESRRSDYEWKRRREEEEERKATEERRVVYVGNLTDKTTRDDLYDNFRTFGPIECIRLRFKPDGHNYGFVTFKDRKDAFHAIENNKKDKTFPYKEVSFGGRRAFCQREYSDLDGRKAYAEERHNGRTNDNDDDFSTLLKKYAESQKRQRS